ncbi:MAG: bifunctional nuclease family protein [Actinobacteria bacterium]|nr:bifunctional nuclease family protein [Actinomycetota bacterium]
MEVPMQLARIIISENDDQQIIILKETKGTRNFPIVIGIAEAAAIDRRLKKRSTPRPPTHELLASVIKYLGGKVERVVINDLRDRTFFALLHIRQGDKVIQIDSRPSDAIALGIGQDVPIFVEEKVLEAVT